MHAFAGFAGATKNSRRILLALITLVLAVGLAAGHLTSPAQAADTDTRGLFGSQDPTYDGVDRQSTAILGLVSIGAKVPKRATSWLLRQQCDDGSFTAYRANPTRPCGPADLTTYTGPNSNSTALAVMALRSLESHDPSVRTQARQAKKDAVAWLLLQQQADGGWEWLEGLGSDSTSTAMALAAIDRPDSETHQRGVAFLLTTLQTGMGCSVSFTPNDPIVNPLSTSWTFIATQGSLPYDRYRGSRALTTCDEANASIVATGSWLASSLIEGAGRIPSATDPMETDWNVTALGTLGMTQQSGSIDASRLGLSALKGNVNAYVRDKGIDRAAPLGTLLMVAHASGADPRNFGGVNLQRRLLATLQK